MNPTGQAKWKATQNLQAPGELAQQFQAPPQPRLPAAEDDLPEARELQTILLVQQAITSRLDPQVVLQMIADEARRLTGADMSAVFLLQGGHLVIHVVSGCPRANTLNFSIPLEGSIGILAAQTGRAWIVEDLNAPGQAGRPEGAVSGVGELIQNLDIRSFIVAPLASAGGLLGTIAVAGKRPGLGHAAARRLEMLAPGAVIALENARLYAQAQQTADLLGRQRAIEEHQRLARELHDAVIQTLFSVSLIAEVLPSLWKRNPQEGQARLDELRRLTRGALAEMRGLLDQSPLPGSADTGRFLEKEH